MTGDGVAVIDMTKLLRVKGDFATAIQRYVHLLRFDLGDRAEFAINNSFVCERSTKLNPITLGEWAFGFLVNTHAGKPRRVVSEYAAIVKANRDLVLLMVGG